MYVSVSDAVWSRPGRSIKFHWQPPIGCFSSFLFFSSFLLLFYFLPNLSIPQVLAREETKTKTVSEQSDLLVGGARA